MTNRKVETTPVMGAATLDLAEQLICCRSVTPDDGGCQRIIAKRLEAVGFRLETFNRAGVTNLWARRGQSAPVVCFAGHTDVVPPGPLEQWRSDPFQPSRRDGFLYGRGASDMKGSIAAFVAAAEAFVAARPLHDGSIAILLTSDEEGEATDGTIAVVEALVARGESIDYGIVGEPTSAERVGDTIKNGRRGSLSGKLRIKGIQGHVAYPHLAKNPIHLVVPALVEMASMVWDRGDESFPPTTWQISEIQSSAGADNVIPGHIDLRFNFRFGTASTPETLKAHVIAVLDRHDLDYEIEWTLGARPYLTPPGTLVDVARQAIREEMGLEADLSTSGGASDGRFIADICPQVIEIGPVNASIHQIDECVEIDALNQLSAIYLRILNHLLP